MKTVVINIAMGTLFGFILARAGVADFARVTNMFALEDFHLVGVLAVAVPVAALGLWLMRGKNTLGGSRFAPRQKLFHKGNLPGGLLFGAGWALTGACPGTSLVQVGTGHLAALFTVGGMAVGLLVYRQVHKRYFSWPMDTCG